jgi:hypothetical protein
MSLSQPYYIINKLVANLSSGDISQHKSTLLTLHFLFPHEFLPALDILDRQLITRMIVSDSLGNAQKNVVHYVQSASATTSRPTKTSRHHTATIIAYEVRLAAWNCSCPAFAYSAFGKGFRTALLLENHPIASHDQEDSDRADSMAHLGGVLTRADTGVPICKHILAAFLGTAAPDMFGKGVCTRDVDEAEAAGWAGGWGD